MIVTLFIVSILVFVLANFIGDPVNMLVSPKAPPEVREQVREELGLNRPILEQYVSFVTNAFKGDFGKSYKKTDACVSRSVIEKTHALLRSVLNQAVIWEYIPSNPALRVTLPKYQPQERTVWSAGEAQ